MNAVKSAPAKASLFLVPKDKPSRTRKLAPSAQAPVDFAEFAASKRGFGKERKRVVSQATFDKAMRDIEQMIADDNWTKARGVHFVALFAQLFEHVYGVGPVFTGTDRAHAVMRAANLLKSKFNSDKADFVNFIRWTWQREERNEKWRRANDRPSRPIGAGLQFSTAFVSDYCVDVARAHKQP